jgi:hypothetical protein
MIKKIGHFLVKPTFLTENLRIGLVWSKFNEFLYFFFEKYSKLNKKYKYDAYNIIKCLFEEL